MLLDFAVLRPTNILYMGSLETVFNFISPNFALGYNLTKEERTAHTVKLY